MSTRREVILSWLCEKRQTWRLCYLLGEAGSGKTWLAQQLQKDKHRRVITLSLVVSWQGKAAWIVTDDNAAEQGCRDSAWTRDEMAGQLLHALHRTDSRCPLIIIENALNSFKQDLSTEYGRIDPLISFSSTVRLLLHLVL